MAKNDKNNSRGGAVEVEDEPVQVSSFVPRPVYLKLDAAATEGERPIAAQVRMILKQWADKQPMI